MTAPPVEYRVAILGLGGIARAHLRAYREAANAGRLKIVAGADISEEARDAFAQEAPGITMYTDYRELLEKEQPEVLSICTWPPLHPDMVEAATAAGVKAILCEKPMAVDLAGCDRMIRAAEASGTLLVIGHQRRLLPKLTRAREIIAAGEIGEPVQLTGIANGDLLSDGTHTVDVLRFLSGDAPVAWVIGNIDRRERLPAEETRAPEPVVPRMRYGHLVESGAVAMLAFESGLRATMEHGICTRPGYQRFRVYGSDGAIEIAGDRPVYEGEPLLRARRRGASGWQVLDPELPAVNGFAREVDLLVESLEQGTPHPLRAESARRTHEVLMAIYESARRRARIDLPLDLADSPLELLFAEERAGPGGSVQAALAAVRQERMQGAKR